MAQQGAVPIPRLPRPDRGSIGREGVVTPRYLEELVSALEQALEAIATQGPARHTGLALTNIQANGAGLRIDDVFEEAGFLKIVRTSEGFAASFVATASVGDVTVVTT